MRIIRLEEVDSTNSYVERNFSTLSHGDVVMTRNQKAGRGQRGNSWESEPGENITFTMLLKPSIEASHQFALSSMVALQVCDTLNHLCGIECKVKWPNDIYTCCDRKICGILISHSLQGKNISHSVVGMGININQRRFHSAAPNPVSLFQLTGKRYDCDTILHHLASNIEQESLKLAYSSYREDIMRRYRNNLWRGDGGNYPFLDQITGEKFLASVHDIEPTGHLILLDTQGTKHRYAFKEVQWL